MAKGQEGPVNSSDGYPPVLSYNMSRTPVSVEQLPANAEQPPASGHTTEPGEAFEEMRLRVMTIPAQAQVAGVDAASVPAVAAPPLETGGTSEQ